MLLANIGLPMLVVIWPLAAFAFIPIVAIETEVIRRRLGVRFKEAMAAVAGANVLTTVVGIPITWGLLVLIQFAIPGGGRGFYGEPPWKIATLGAAWMAPASGRDPNGWWVFPVANIVLLVPLWASSSFIEAVANRSSFGKTAAVTRATWLANLASYGLLALFWLVMLAIGAGRR